MEAGSVVKSVDVGTGPVTVTTCSLSDDVEDVDDSSLASDENIDRPEASMLKAFGVPSDDEDVDEAVDDDTVELVEVALVAKRLELVFEVESTKLELVVVLAEVLVVLSDDEDVDEATRDDTVGLGEAEDVVERLEFVVVVGSKKLELMLELPARERLKVVRERLEVVE